MLKMTVNMNKRMKLILVCFLFLTQYSFGQTYNYPKCNSQAEPDLKIIKITRGDYSTVIDFEYVNSEAQGIYILLYSANTEGAYYIKADGKTYKLTSTNGIGNANGITPASQYKPVNFTATFEAIPKTVTQFDLIEGGSTGSWHFYGIQLNSTQSLANECDNIKYIAKSSKPDFKTLLAGVKYAVIANSAKINGHVPAFNALVEFLKAMKFESVEFLNENYEQPRNLCEEVWVEIHFDYDFEKFYNISMTFTNRGTDYSWKFSTSKIARAGLYDDPKYNFGQALRDMYGYTKGTYNSYYTMQLAKKQTCWTETKLKNYILSKGCDKIEGIYENTGNSDKAPKYKIAVRKISGTYYLIYLSGAYNTGNWSEGEIKATLEPTATPLLFKAQWLMSNKSENSNCYITFEQGFFNLLSENNEKELYIKMFPSSTDNISNSHSESSSSGTGYAISSNGYIVTNHHVTNGASSIKIRGVSGDFSKTYNAKVIIEDKNNDLSIIKIDDPSFISLGTIPYVIANRASDVGSSVFVLGYPLRATMGDEVKLTNGIISSKSGFQGDVTSYQITVPVQPGNSGGPLFDDKGNIIGIINAKHFGAENASYAIKASYLMNLIDLMQTPPKLQTVSTVVGKPLTEQVKILKKFTYIIEIN